MRSWRGPGRSRRVDPAPGPGRPRPRHLVRPAGSFGVRTVAAAASPGISRAGTSPWAPATPHAPIVVISRRSERGMPWDARREGAARLLVTMGLGLAAGPEPGRVRGRRPEPAVSRQRVPLLALLPGRLGPDPRRDGGEGRRVPLLAARGAGEGHLRGRAGRLPLGPSDRRGRHDERGGRAAAGGRRSGPAGRPVHGVRRAPARQRVQEPPRARGRASRSSRRTACPGRCGSSTTSATSTRSTRRSPCGSSPAATPSSASSSSAPPSSASATTR